MAELQRFVNTSISQCKRGESYSSPYEPGYTREYYLQLVERVRRAVPGISLTTDLIVGFPGETEEDFAETLSLVEEVRFDSAFTFIFFTTQRHSGSENDGPKYRRK